MLQGEADGQLILPLSVGQVGAAPPRRVGPIVSCALSADCASAFASTFGGELLLCDLRWFTTRTLRMHDGQPCRPARTRSDGALITASTNGRVALWRVEQGMPITVHERGRSRTRFAAVSGQPLCRARRGQLFVVWDFELNAGCADRSGAFIDGCAISPNGRFLLLLLRTGWSVCGTNSVARRDDLSVGRCDVVAFAPDGGSALIGHASGAVA
jgi:hypothetical protein